MNVNTSYTVIICVVIIAGFGSLTTCAVTDSMPENQNIQRMKICLERPDMKWETSTWGSDKCVPIKEEN